MGAATIEAGAGHELDARERWTRDELLAYQRERLQALLHHAVARSPYYREALGSAPLADDLASFPVLSKPTLMAEFDRIVTDPRLRLGELGAADPDELFAGEYRVFSTSGTTGVPALVVFSREEWARWVAVGFRAFAQFGLTADLRLAPIGAPSPQHVTRQLFRDFAAGRERPPALFVTTPLEELVVALNDYLPDAIATYPSIAGLLAGEQLAGRLAIAPTMLAVGSEVLSEETERRILEAWGIRAANVYASTEVVFIATRRPGEETWDVCEDHAIVEVVDEQNRPVPPGVPGAKVLLTSLVQRAQPLIRYELSDSVVVASGTANGRPWARIERIDGRSDDVLRFPRVGGGEVSVLPYRLRVPFGRVEGVAQYQIVEEERRLRVRVVPGPEATPTVCEDVRRELAAELREAGAVVPAIDVEAVRAIEREPGPAAKIKVVKALRR